MTTAVETPPPAAPETAPAETKPAPAEKPAAPPQEKPAEEAPPKDETAPETASAPEEEGEEEDDDVAIETTLEGKPVRLTGSAAVEHMNSIIKRALDIVDGTKKANSARLEKPLEALLDELAVGKFEGDRQAAHAHLFQLMEAALLQHLEEQDKPEAERRAAELERELQLARAELAKQRQEQEEEAYREKVADASERLAMDFHESFKALELPDDDDFRLVVVERMLAQRKAGLQPTVRSVAEKLKKEMDALTEVAVARKLKQSTKDEIEAVRKSREEGIAPVEEKARPSKDGPVGKLLRSKDFLRDD